MIEVDNKSVNKNSDFGYLLTTGVKTFTTCEIIQVKLSSQFFNNNKLLHK